MTDDALLTVGAHLRVAATAALAEAAPGSAEAGEPELRENALEGLETPAVVAAVPLDAGTSGTVLLALTAPGALRLAAVLGAIDEEAAEVGGADLDQAALDAIAALAAKLAARAVSEGDLPADAGRAAARVVAEASELARAASGGEAAVVPLTVLGEPALAVHVVPLDVLARLGEAGDPLAAPVAPPVGAAPLGSALRDVSVRVWAELGRARMPTGEVVGLPSGAIVELDREAEDAVDLYVDGQLYATGRLVVCDDESWGVRVERVLGLS
jgi:flagellar motor switch protein FliN/FliY